MCSVFVSVQYPSSHTHPSDVHGCFTHQEFTAEVVVKDVAWVSTPSENDLEMIRFLVKTVADNVRDIFLQSVRRFQFKNESLKLFI